MTSKMQKFVHALCPLFLGAGLIALVVILFEMPASAQTTNGSVTGVVTDQSGAVVAGAQVAVTNQGTGLLRTTTTNDVGFYIVPQLTPGTYEVSIKKQSFAIEDRPNIQLEVNQNVSLDFKLTVASAAQTIKVTEAAPLIDVTSATISDVVDHGTAVGLPLNGRNFTQLALLTPGVAPAEGSQQPSFIVALGAGGISPAVNGQRGQQNNYTMDGVLNNSTFLNFWAISPPPDALEEFNVQSHITDAQFAISSGANINIVTRSGTNTFHGAMWEFLRNSVLDADQFPSTVNLPYRQNQYGYYFGGPVILPHFNGKDNTFFSTYWEGFRSIKTNTLYASTPTTAMDGGDFSAVLGTTPVGTDDLGRPEYANEIYDPETSRTDPVKPAAIIRDPFPGNIIPPGRINPDAAPIIAEYYPAPNMNVAPGVLPNLVFSGSYITLSNQFGIRFDHRFGENNLLFFRYNRVNDSYSTPEALPGPPSGFANTTFNYAQSYAIGYTHLFGPKTILDFRYGYTETNVGRYNTSPGAAFLAALNMSEAILPRDGFTQGPYIEIASYSSALQNNTVAGPQQGHDFHLDLTKVVGHHTFGVGGMFYHLMSNADGFSHAVNFTQNATSVSGGTGSTGYGPASFDLGLPGGITFLDGNTGVFQTNNWYGGYAQDQWQALRKLAITFGLRYDFLAPPNLHKVISGIDLISGLFVIDQPYLPLYPTANVPSHYFYPQIDGYEPRLGIAYQVTHKTVFRTAFAMMDDHNDPLVQDNQDLRESWPTSIGYEPSTLNQGLPTLYANALPSAASLLAAASVYSSDGEYVHDKIPYVMEYNAGIEQQLSNSMMLMLDYVGSIGRHNSLVVIGNTAPTPGPGSLASRGQPFPQYGGSTVSYDANVVPTSYNALQAELKKSLSSGLLFEASYTWSKSLDEQSDGHETTEENYYHLRNEWGPSDFNRTQVLVVSGVYALPVGKAMKFLSTPNRFEQAVAGGWNISGIMSFNSGTPFDAVAGGDVANVGGGAQRAERIAGVNPYATSKTHAHWLNPAAFATPTTYTFGNESRNDLVGPPYKDVDFSAYKDFLIAERATIQFRSEVFNIFNHTNYSTPGATTETPSSFGEILSATGASREAQFALKVSF